MKIERIDDKTVKCFLSNEELNAYNIDYKDFVLRNDKAKEVVHDIMEQAKEEVGYEPPQFAFELQIMVVPEQGLILTFSEKLPSDLQDSGVLMDCLREMQRSIAGQLAEKQEPEAEKQEKSLKKLPGKAVFRFASVGEVMDFANMLPETLRIASSLYAQKGEYYLLINQGRAAFKTFKRVCVQAMEYGTLYAVKEDRILFLKEHCECLIAEGAVKKLQAKRPKRKTKAEPCQVEEEQ